MSNEVNNLLILQQKQFFYLIVIKLAIAGLMCLSGFVLLILGITGSVELEVNAADIQGKLINASPGLVFVFLGMFIILKTHHKYQQSIEKYESGEIKTIGSAIMHGMVRTSQNGNIVRDLESSKNWYEDLK